MTETQSALSGVLHGIRVLDFGRYIAGPYCAALLADLGADVVRIERREGGEDRWVAPVAADGAGALYLAMNRNKRGMTLDPAHPQGREIVQKLVATADVVVANLPPEVLRSLSLDLESLRRVKPDIILTTVTAFGAGGPWSHRHGFDGIGQLMSGAAYLTGTPEHRNCTIRKSRTLAQEDAKRPNRERESLVGEQSRIVNRMKAALARLGIRGFNPKLKKAVERLDGLRTPEGEPIPPNTLAELKHDMERRRLVRSQIRDIEGTRLERLKQAPGDGPHVMVRLLARVIGVGVETADMLVQEVLSRNLRDRRAVARYGGLTGSPDESGKKRREKGLARSGNAQSPARHDPTGMAVSDVPEGQRLGALVLRTHEKCASDPQDNDCGAGTQAADRPVAARAGGRDPGGYRPASSFMSGVT